MRVWFISESWPKWATIIMTVWTVNLFICEQPKLNDLKLSTNYMVWYGTRVMIAAG